MQSAEPLFVGVTESIAVPQEGRVVAISGTKAAAGSALICRKGKYRMLQY